MASFKASADHLQLASVIRGVHRDLRRRYKNCRVSEDELWAEHCSRRDVLNEYASAMHRLASTHWVTNNETTRIERCYAIMKDYFGFRERQLESLARDDGECRAKSSRIRLLDVGSCYNPFAIYEDLDVLAIDLCPATRDVRKCDFLNLHISTELTSQSCAESVPPNADACGTVDSLPSGHFDAVVFSLFLEYFPSRRQRLKCCVFARDLLANDGLLIVATPDSKHGSRNSCMVKSWRIAFESIGFKRIHYEKQTHLHYMAFRCGGHRPVVDFEVLSELLYIPQDFNEYDDDEPRPRHPVVSRTADEDAALVKAFMELTEINFDG